MMRAGRMLYTRHRPKNASPKHAKHRLAEDEQHKSAGHAGEVAEKDAHTSQEKTRAAPQEGQLILAMSWL